MSGPDTILFTATGEEDGNVLIFRGRQEIPAGVAELDYPILLSVSWPYQAESNNGMPDEMTNERQIEFEDTLEGLDSLDSGVLMLVVTGNGRKEWHWYVANLDAWMERLNESLANRPTFPIEIEDRHQPGWDLYHGFMSGLKGG
jgi:Family of unknown function (DUF695)